MHTTSHPLKPLLALALAGGIVISSLSACGGESGSSPDISDGTTSADTADTLADAVTTEPEETLPADNLPDTDLSGYTFRIYSLDECAKFFYSDALDGDVVNDAIYQSIMNVEERFGADVQCVIFGSGDGDFNGAINKIILAGDDVFDVAENHDTLSGDSSLKGLYLNILDFPYLDFEQPWYPTNAIDSLTLYGKLQDKFGDNGVVSVVIGEKQGAELHMRLWLMSCRVLKREMEFAMMDALVARARAEGVKTIWGYYYPTAKNGMVKDFYGLLGFAKVSEDEAGNSVWKFDVTDDYQKQNHSIWVEDAAFD